MKSEDIVLEFEKSANPKKATELSRFFKTGPGDYGEGDIFLGIAVLETRKIIKKYYRDMGLYEISRLLRSEYHECRMAALAMLVEKFKRADDEMRKLICKMYLENTKYVNNWDLVDLSACYIVGPMIDEKLMAELIKMAKSTDIWKRRIAMMACFHQIKNGDSKFAFEIIDILKNDDHDLIQKVVGWMLREIGKRCSRQELVDWLNFENRYQTIPRTELRYAIEHFDEPTRQKYLKNLI